MQIWQTHLDGASQSGYSELFDVVPAPVWSTNIGTYHLGSDVPNVMHLVHVVLLPFFPFGNFAVTWSLSRLMSRDDAGDGWQGPEVFFHFPWLEEHKDMGMQRCPHLCFCPMRGGCGRRLLHKEHTRDNQWKLKFGYTPSQQSYPRSLAQCRVDFSDSFS